MTVGVVLKLVWWEAGLGGRVMATGAFFPILPSRAAEGPRNGKGASSLLPFLTPAWTLQGKYADLLKVYSCSVALQREFTRSQ